MEQTMARGVGLTPQQKQLLDLACQEAYFVKHFYLSGGTALSLWYYHHRESLDLDFFSLAPFDYDRITRWFRHNKKRIGYTTIRFDEDYGFLIAILRFPNTTALKIDFHHYSKIKLSPGFRWNGLEIDSLIDIAVNKLQTIATIPRARDYVDLYFILKNTAWQLLSLLPKVEKKFREPIDTLQLAKNFLKVSEYTDLPTILVPFDANDMHHYYERLAQKLKPAILS